MRGKLVPSWIMAKSNFFITNLLKSPILFNMLVRESKPTLTAIRRRHFFPFFKIHQQCQSIEKGIWTYTNYFYLTRLLVDGTDSRVHWPTICSPILRFVSYWSLSWPPWENNIVRRINLFSSTGKATEMDKKRTLFLSTKRETRTNFVLEYHF